MVVHENTSTTIEDVWVEKNKKALQFIEDATTNAGEIQKSLLSEILSRNAHVEYLRRHGLDVNGTHIDHRETTFKKVIPVITYEDLKPDIQRIANGDTSPILCSQPISEFYVSSGTSSGNPKLMLTTEEQAEQVWFFRSLVMPVMNQHIPGLDKGKAMYFTFTTSKCSKTPGGWIARPALASLFKSSQFKNLLSSGDPYYNYTSPIETILCEDNYQSMYSQLLCGLCQNDTVVRVGTVFCYSFILVIRFLEEHWTLLCNDIRTGTIDKRITDPLVRQGIIRAIALNPNPVLADFIEMQCSMDNSSSWKGIIPRLWPNTKCIETIVSGSMSKYIPALDYYSNGLPIVSASPNGVGDDRGEKRQQDTVVLADVKLGQEYELVVTTIAGLYRFRVGDVLRVTGFMNKAPQFNFVCRRGVVLSIDADKTDETELQNAIENAIIKHLLPLQASLEDYTSYADPSIIPGHYVLYWELHSFGNSQAVAPNGIPSSVFEDCCITIEECLSSVYRAFRVAGKISSLEIKVVKQGSFRKMMEHAKSQGASISQYKTPGCLKSIAMVDLMNSMVVTSYFSPKCPSFVSGHSVSSG
ncbi:indole-3-acetic acid-amido synthetase GH3.6-like isoform X2 [Papaver somniferum]|uniref:indole-3-acetic acid-amido synthetase GH3.6-like isoform X2 n=1 Tax=Papaver somniferum TaxID=3469 RepID=UPI000E7019E4|nr:indole-3-acetic acid-amido synthetase GH3.6-like isoform X2 [Papaver somniferum]